MRKIQLLTLLAFVALFGAGAVSALVANRYINRPAHVEKGDRNPQGRQGGGGSFLVRALDLTPEQHEQMRKIWSEMDEKRRENWAGRRESDRQRDKEVEAMLSPEQRRQHLAINAAHEARMKQIADANDELNRQAEQKTRELLTDAQRIKYDEFLKREKERGRGDRRGGPGSRPAGQLGGGLGGPGGPDFPGRGGMPPPPPPGDGPK